MKAIISKFGAPSEEWGNVMNIKYDGEAQSIDVSHGDGQGQLRYKSYGCGQWSSVLLDANSKTEYENFPDDARRI